MDISIRAFWYKNSCKLFTMDVVSLQSIYDFRYKALEFKVFVYTAI